MKLNVEELKLDAIKSDERNARRHSSRNLEAIAGSLAEFGQRKPIVVTTDNVVIAGNGTVEAAKKLGWTSVSATRIPKDWTSEQIRAYAIADNRAAELATWDQNELLNTLEDIDNNGLLGSVGFDTQDLDDLKALMEEINVTVPAPAAPAEQSGVTYTPSLTDYAERYAQAATRVLMCDYPNDVYVWIIERLAKIRTELDVTSNAEAILSIIAQHTQEQPPVM